LKQHGVLVPISVAVLATDEGFHDLESL